MWNTRGSPLDEATPNQAEVGSSTVRLRTSPLDGVPWCAKIAPTLSCAKSRPTPFGAQIAPPYRQSSNRLGPQLVAKTMDERRPSTLNTLQ